MKTKYNPETKEIEDITEEEFLRTHREQIDFDKIKRIVFKVGSDLLDEVYISKLAEQLLRLRRLGKQVVLVSSGAIKTSKEVLTLEGDDALNQAYAAIGQHMLMTKYALAFRAPNIAQTLFTDEDLSGKNPMRYLNARNTLNLLINNNIIPIVNENDSVAVDEIKVGDNDTLSALIAKMVGADVLVMLSKNGLYDKKPDEGNGERPINIVPCIDDTIRGFGVEEPTGYGVGGPKTKIEAAEILEGSVPVLLMNGRDFNYEAMFKGKYDGTLFCTKK